MKTFRLITMMVALASVFPVAADAQVVREDGAKSIAGVLSMSGATSAEWTFKSAGGEILFASLDGDIYRKSAHGSEHSVTAAAEPGGGCSDEGGPSAFKIQVVKDYGDAGVLCEASRPAPPPGWQRDPRLACELPKMRSPASYKVRVVFVEPEDATPGATYPFLLNLSLRKIAPSGTNIQSAFATSGASGF